MFLLPPVPGLPVYIFAGILIAEKARAPDSIGFWMGCVLASALGLFTKICACCGQYMIGYFLGKSIKVQQLIGVDTVPTRAIEHVLKSRGLNPGKVALLVGGPDWPTSVTCGIVGVNIPQMCLGTLPVVTLLAPCVLAGACMGRVKPGEDSSWTMLANGFTAFAAVVNMGSFAFAVRAVSTVIQNHGEELAKPRPEHEAVSELTRREQAMVDCYNNTIRWESISTFWKAILLAGACGTTLCNMVFIGLAEMCFRTFAISSKIDAPYEEDGLDKKAWTIVRPVGYMALGTFFAAVMMHILFVKAMQRRANAAMKSSQ